MHVIVHPQLGFPPKLFLLSKTFYFRNTKKAMYRFYKKIHIQYMSVSVCERPLVRIVALESESAPVSAALMATTASPILVYAALAAILAAPQTATPPKLISIRV
jgi:hypothetical protein